MFLLYLVPWSYGKFYGAPPRGTPPSGKGLNARAVAKYSDFGSIEAYISETVQDRRFLVLITNRKSYISYRLVSKSVTLNQLERRNGAYSALFHRIRVRCRRKKSSRWLSHLLMSFLFYYFFHCKYICLVPFSFFCHWFNNNNNKCMVKVIWHRSCHALCPAPLKPRLPYSYLAKSRPQHGCLPVTSSPPDNALTR